MEEKSEENEFIKSLKTETQNKIAFPPDSKIIEQMDSNEKQYFFDMGDIDQKIKVSNLTKNGEQLFLYRKKIVSKDFCGYCKIFSQYYIINSEGKVVGRIPVSTRSPSVLTMDFWIRDGYRDKGIGTVALNEVLKQIYEKRVFDGREYKSIEYPDITETMIEKIELEINDNNEASKKIATKSGFKKVGKESYDLSIDDYLLKKSSTFLDID